MKKFAFRLQTVLEHRERQVGDAKAAVLEAEAVLREAEDAVNRLQQEVDHTEELARKAQIGSIDAQNISDTLVYLRGIQERIAAAQDGLIRLRNILAEKRKNLTEALKKQKVLENLRDRHLQKWREELKAEETNMLDEIATIRYVRTRDGSLDES